MSVTVLHQRWYEHLAARAGALDLVLLLAGLIALWLVYARWLWPRLLPLLRVLLVVIFVVSLIFSGVYSAIRALRVSPARFDTLAVLGWPDTATLLDPAAGPGPASGAPRR